VQPTTLHRQATKYARLAVANQAVRVTVTGGAPLLALWLLLRGTLAHRRAFHGRPTPHERPGRRVICWRRGAGRIVAGARIRALWRCLRAARPRACAGDRAHEKGARHIGMHGCGPRYAPGTVSSRLPSRRLIYSVIYSTGTRIGSSSYETIRVERCVCMHAIEDLHQTSICSIATLEYILVMLPLPERFSFRDRATAGKCLAHVPLPFVAASCLVGRCARRTPRRRAEQIRKKGEELDNFCRGVVAPTI
jgi:hypothetical protein